MLIMKVEIMIMKSLIIFEKNVKVILVIEILVSLFFLSLKILVQLMVGFLKSIIQKKILIILDGSYLFLKIVLIFVSLIIELFIEFVCFIVNVNDIEGFVGIQIFVLKNEDENVDFFCEKIEL